MRIKPSEIHIKHRENPETFLIRFEKRFRHYSAVNPVALGIIVFVVVAAIISALSMPFYKENLWEFWGNVLVEGHGMIFDLLIIGVFVFWLHRIGYKQLIIIRYREEIDDYLGWQHQEAMFKIITIIKKLNHWGVSNIHLVEAHLKKAFLKEVNLKGANLDGANLIEANLTSAHLKNAYLIGADLTRANLTGAILINTDLRRADLRGAIFTKAKLRGVNLEGAMYDDLTKWPKGFNPKKTEAIFYWL
ncbi:pentapeptide repeat-containing protein [Candidatus Halobeggiatoa sp. HSG11]|nr:pentapeptide repeat-containing protein [Candidatus Halobeggiatoa sp. HSG11]